VLFLDIFAQKLSSAQTLFM